MRLPKFTCPVTENRDKRSFNHNQAHERLLGVVFGVYPQNCDCDEGDRCLGGCNPMGQCIIGCVPKNPW
jgi:hypothetical protein